MLEHRERVERHEVRRRREQRHGVGVGLAAGLEAAQRDGAPLLHRGLGERACVRACAVARACACE